MTIRANALRNIILPIGDLFFGQQMMKRLKFLEEAQYWPLDQIQVETSGLFTEFDKGCLS